MEQIISYILISIVIISLVIMQIQYHRFYYHSLKEKLIDSHYEHRVERQFVILMGIVGLSASSCLLLLDIIEKEIIVKPIGLIIVLSIITIGFSVFGWIGFWLTDYLLRAKIKTEIKKEENKQ